MAFDTDDPNDLDDHLRTLATQKPLDGFDVCVDLDGTLAMPVKPFDLFVIGVPFTGAQKMIRTLLDMGARVVIDSTRLNAGIHRPEQHGMDQIQGDKWARKLRANIENWLDQWGFPARGGNFKVNDTPGKPLALAYIDDRAVPYRGEVPMCRVTGPLSALTLAQGEKSPKTGEWVMGEEPQPGQALYHYARLVGETAVAISDHAGEHALRATQARATPNTPNHPNYENVNPEAPDEAVE